MSETNVDMLKPTELQIKKIAEEMEDKSAMEVLKWAINTYAPKIALASSFGAEDVILIDMMVKINKEKAKIFTLDRKVHPLNRALSKLDGWITGLRREQAITRANIYKLEIDSSHGNIAKINPLADWTNEMIWDYIHKNNVPYNKLHDSGYPSIGCEPCTRAVHRGEDPRAGRWWWENATQKECGLHWDPTKKYQK